MRKIMKEKMVIEFDLYTDGSKYKTTSASDELIFIEKLKILLKEYIGPRFEVLDLDYKFDKVGQT